MIAVPKRAAHRPTKASNNKYYRDCSSFAAMLIREQELIDFKMGSRDWCYHLEGKNIITKAEFDVGEKLITDMRKGGDLPLDFTIDDDSRAAVGVVIPDNDTETTLDDWKRGMMDSVDSHCPSLLSDQTGIHIELMVEKTGLRSLYAAMCKKYQIPITNGKGQSDINSRVDLMRRCHRANMQGKEVHLLYCGDFDPYGLVISSGLMDNLKTLTPATGIDPSFINIDVFGLTYDYIMKHNLVWVDNLFTASSKKTKMGLDNPKHPDHYKDYVQTYLKKYCDGGKNPRKVEANALINDIAAGRKLLQDTIDKLVSPQQLIDYNESLLDSRHELKETFEKLWA